jgi:PAS domain S-box-containing protein
MNYTCSMQPFPLDPSSQGAIQRLQEELEHLQQRLQVCEFQQRQRIAAMPQITWIAAADGSRIDFNPPWYEYTGLSEAESLGWRFITVIHPQERKDILNSYKEAIHQGRAYQIEYRMLGACGSYCKSIERAAPVMSEDGKILEWVGVCILQQLPLNQVLSCELAAQNQAEIGKQRYMDLADAMPLVVWTARSDGVWNYCNQRWFDYTGMTASEIETRGWQSVVHPEDLPNCVEAWETNVRIGTAYEIECRFQRVADGMYRWHLVRAFPQQDERGEIAYWVGTCVDIDDRHQMEKALKARAEELTYVTAILTQTNRALEKRNQELDQFAYVASHDLKAPLRAIANLSQWIEEDLDDRLNDENRYQMQLLRGRVNRLESLIEGLLQYSRVGRFQTEVETVDVEDLLAEVISSFTLPAGFTVIVEAGMPRIMTQRLLLLQVFSNLLSNAIKHHHRLDGRVTISVVERGKFYEFAVADDGPGIAPQYHEKIFGIFQTLEARDKVENTGVGLAIVKKIVEGHGGTICVESQVGRGATFRFTWPRGGG